MATQTNWWRSARAEFGTLGTKTFFVDWDFGHDDTTADGTPEHPYATISHGYAKIVAETGTAPSGCIVRGHGNEAFVGNHAFTVKGDYWGAAFYDGGGTAQIIYCTMRNLIYLNGGTNIDVDYSVSPYGNNIRAAFAGCGRASLAGNANNAGNVYGVASSPILIGNSKMYRGCIGGIQATGYNIYAKIKCSPYTSGQGANACGTTFGGQGLSASAQIGNCVVYDLPLQVRAITKTAQNQAGRMFRWIFGKVDFIYEHGDYFYQCLFASDCRMFYVDKKSDEAYYNKRLLIIPEEGTNSTPEFTYDSTTTELDFQGAATGGTLTVKGVGIKTFYDALVALYNAGHLGTSNPATFFDANCKFSAQTSGQIFNNPEHYDFSTKRDSDAYISTYHYFGALPPAQNVPILGTGNSGSDQAKECWDNRTIDGCLKVEDGVIKIDTASSETEGRIFSKIIKTNPYQIQFNGIYAMLNRRVKNGWIASKINPFGTNLTPDANRQVTVAASTQYVVKGSKADFNDHVFNINDVIDTTGVNTLTVEFETSAGYLMPIKDANIPDTLYCRCRSMIYARAGQSENLLAQVTYLNDGDRYVKFAGRVIIPGESFVCNTAQAFSVCDAQGNTQSDAPDYTVAVIFDDRETIPAGEERIGGETKWIPAQIFGEYFAMKNAGAIAEMNIAPEGETAIMVPKSSGNYQCFTKNGGGAMINGYKSILNQTFVQFALFVTVVSDFDVVEE